MAFRRARQSGDYRGALAASQLGDQMGLQIGTTVHDEAIKGLGMRRFRDSMEKDRLFGGRLGSGMGAGFPGQQDVQDAPGQQQLGVGGYDFNQRVGSPLAQQQPSTLDLQRAVARRKWQMAKTTEEKDAITEESAAKGLTTNPSAVQDALMRRRGNFGVPQLSAVGGSQQQTAAPNETIPLRPNIQLGGPPSDKVMEGYTPYQKGAGNWIRPIKTGIRGIASAGQYIRDNQTATAEIEKGYQDRMQTLERLKPDYAGFQGDLEKGYAETVLNASPFPGLPPDESMRQTLMKSRRNRLSNSRQ